MRIKLNGDPYELAGPVTIGELLAKLGIDGRRVAVEYNLVVLKRAAFDQTIVREGDEIEVVNFVGGGSAGKRSGTWGPVSWGMGCRTS
jgi:thiamine biosynthesis protein ThiS